MMIEERVKKIKSNYKNLIAHKNKEAETSNGVYARFINPVLTPAHVPLNWRYDFNLETNPLFLERIAVNAVFNAGAIKLGDKYVVVARVEGADRKSYFAVAESDNGVDGFTFWDKPIVMPQTNDWDTNVYDMRLTQHEDGWIYGLFCTERKDPEAPEGDTSMAVANAGIARTKDLITWERLPDLVSQSGQQRNVVLHPEFVDGKYALYTRPQDGFIDVGGGGGIGLAYIKDMESPIIEKELIINAKQYHTIYELKNGLGPAPIKTSQGWLHLAHGVRNTAAGLRYVLYVFMTDLYDLGKVIHQPGGYLMAPECDERVGDVSNVLFSNGWIADDDGTVYIYYASSDTRLHVAKSSVNQLLDYAMNTPQDDLYSHLSVNKIHDLIDNNVGHFDI